MIGVLRTLTALLSWACPLDLCLGLTDMQMQWWAVQASGARGTAFSGQKVQVRTSCEACGFCYFTYKDRP